MTYDMRIIVRAHFLQSGREVTIIESGSFLGIYKRLRHYEERDNIEIDNISFDELTIH